MTRHYYNENDPFAVKWLKNLIAKGLIPAGDVDDRSIKDVQGSDLEGYVQCHFFAGIGGWPYALQLAGWPADRPVWTGSCPCQPFSSAGRRGAESDDRHLWPTWYGLIEVCRPAIVFGEQVASKDGRHWLAGVRADLELLDYAVGASDLCAAGIGAPHIRQRLYWMGVADCESCEWNTGTVLTAKDQRQREGQHDGDRPVGHPDAGQDGSRLADVGGERHQGSNGKSESRSTKESRSRQINTGAIGNRGVALGDTEQPGLEGHAGDVIDRHEPGRLAPSPLGPTAPPGWNRFDVVRCVEPTRRGGQVEKWRRVEPGTFPLAHGVSERVGRLRGYGNAIVPQLAAEFIRASVEAITDCNPV